MLTVMSLLNEIRRRPGMFLGRASIAKLAPFLNGYQLAMHRAGVKAPDELLMASFRDWIHERYKTTKVGWETLILQDSKDDEGEAMDHFWRLLDEFRAKHPEAATQLSTLPVQSSTTPTSTPIAHPSKSA